MNIIYFNRKRGINFSIERVFDTVKENLKSNENIIIDNIFMNYYRVRPLDIIRNLYNTHKHRGVINHIVGDIHYVSLVLPRKNTILTIHDTGNLLNQKFSFKGLFIWFFWYFLPVRRLKYITCISQKTKDEVIKITKCNPNKIIVIYNPIDNQFKRSYKEFNFVCPIILHIGTRDNKNLERVIQSLSGIKCHLRIIGKLSLQQLNLLKEFNIYYTNSFNLSNDQIVQEYIDSDIISFPSTYEGFGMPIIEGQSIGRIVLTSKILPMTEIGEDSVHYVDPYDVNDIKKGFELIIKNDDYRIDLINKGYINVERFSPTNIGLKYYNMYKKISNETSLN